MDPPNKPVILPDPDLNIQLEKSKFTYFASVLGPFVKLSSDETQKLESERFQKIVNLFSEEILSTGQFSLLILPAEIYPITGSKTHTSKSQVTLFPKN